MKSKVYKTRRTRKFKTRKRLFLKNLIDGIKFVLLIAVICTLIYGTYYLFVKSSVFKVHNFEVNGAKNFVNKSDVLTQVKEYVKDQNILKIDETILENTLNNTFLGAKSFSVQKKIPDTLIVTVNERQPLALLKTKNSDNVYKYYLVDDEGYILGLVDPNTMNLPIINYEEAVTVGIFIDKTLIPLYLGLINSSDTAQLKISSVSVNEKYVTFFIDNTIEVLLGKNKDIKQMIFVLKELTKQLSFEGKDVKKIDLRYDKVVVE